MSPASEPDSPGAEVIARRSPRPRFSVFIPVFGNAEWLPGAVESVLRQRYGDWELVVGDNDSAEDLRAIVCRYEDPRIRYHRWQEHVDIFDNFNRTMGLCSNEWVVLLCADDRLHPRYLEALAGAIEAHVDRRARPPAMVLTSARRVRPDGSPAEVEYYGFQGVAHVRSGVYGPAAWVHAVCTPGSMPWEGGAISRSVIGEMRGFYRSDVQSMSADLELALRVAAYGDVVYLDEPLFEVTAWPASHTHDRHSRNLLRREPLTPHGSALLSALAVHRRRRTVSEGERVVLNGAISRSYLRRAAAHRYRLGGQGRAAAFDDVLAAIRYSPRTALAPRSLVLAAGLLVAPSRLLVWLRTWTLSRRSRAQATEVPL